MMVNRDLPKRIQKTGYGWDESRSSYKVQVGTHEVTIAYAWVPVGRLGDSEAIAQATEIANRLCEGWNMLHAKEDAIEKERG